LRRVFEYARPYLGQLALVAATILVISLLSLVPPLLMRDLIDRAIPAHDLGRLTLLGLGMVAVPLVSGVVGVLQRWSSARVGEGIIFDLRRSLFSHLQRMPLRFFTATRTGELMSRLNADVVGAQQTVTGTFITIASNLVTVVATLAIMLRLEWRLTLLAVALLPLFIVSARRVGRVLRRVTAEQMEGNARMSGILAETLNVSGALLVKLFGRRADEEQRYGEEAGRVRDLGVRRALIGRWFFMGLGLVSALGTALVFWVGAYLVIRDPDPTDPGSFTLGAIVAFAAYLANLYGPLTALSNARVDFATSLVSFERVFEVLDLPREIEERSGAVELASVEGAVAFENVWFSYQGDGPAGLEAVRRLRWWGGGGLVEPSPPELVSGRRWALEDISFTVEPGELVALVGPSGAGKTTVTYLVPRLYDAGRGRVLVDGRDVRDLTLDSLASAIGVVTQETYLFHDTVAANLRYARPDATQQELEEASRAANIHEMIVELPLGYETVVGERGYRLSGGEKQRVAIARVILKDPRILILDEATSHLDARSEALIKQALRRVMEGRTSLVIAHRLSTILEADRILVLDRGRIVEQGTHRELMAQSGLYARLYETQFLPESAVGDAMAAPGPLGP
jgi:ATP-binding cassette subfamily B protein